MTHFTRIDPEENRKRMQRGELYYAFTSDLTAARRRCEKACKRFNDADDPTRRQSVQLWRE